MPDVAMTPNPDPPPPDLLPIHFGPCVCGTWPGLPEPESWAALAGWDDHIVEWISGPADLATPTPLANGHGASALWRQRPPVPGERAPVRLGYPFQGQLGEPFWCHVPGALAHYNGYEIESDFDETRVVRAALQQNAETAEPGNGRPVRRAVVLVDKVLTLDDLGRLPPRDGPAGLLEEVRSARREIERCGPWGYLVGRLGDDDAVWALWREQGDGARMLLAWAPGRHVPAFQAGHRPLSPDELAVLIG